jgi:hypothetical protein
MVGSSAGDIGVVRVEVGRGLVFSDQCSVWESEGIITDGKRKDDSERE